MAKQTYYVDLAHREISQIPYQSNTSFKILATSDEVQLLRDKMTGMGDGDNSTFFRAHVPINPYHNDVGNDKYDDNMVGAYQLLYDLGDESTQAHIESMGIIPKD